MSDRLEAIPLDDGDEVEGSAGAADSRSRSQRIRRFLRPTLVVAVLQVVCLAVIAAALVVIAVDERRRTVLFERSECRESAHNFRQDDGIYPPTFARQIEEACGGTDPLEDR